MISEILQLIEQKKFQVARTLLSEENTVDLAEALDEVEQRDLIKLFRMLPKDTAAEVFSYCSRDLQKRIINSITDHELASIMDDLFLDDMVDLIEEMPASVVKRLLTNTDQETRTLINHFLQYPDDSAGSIMTIEYVDLRKDMTVEESFRHIRQTGIDKETIYTCYVTDDHRKLEGIVSIRTLIFADNDAKIDDVMERQFIFVKTLDDQEHIARIFDHYDLLSVPVVDSEMRLVGIITIDDALDVIHEETTEDIEKMAAMLPSEMPYLETSILTHTKQRLPWLLFLMVSATFTGLIIHYFEDAISAIAALVTFIPMLMDTGGNSGSQSATLIIRGMALGEIKTTDGLRILRKELAVSLIVGGILALFNILRILLLNKSIGMALTVGISLFLTVIMSKIIGSLLPLAASKMKMDPAMMASPVITTIVDAGSLIIYFLIARSILHF